MRPKKEQTRRLKSSVVLPEAPIQSSAGNTRAMQSISKMPLKLIGEVPSMYGTWKSNASAIVQIQNAPFTLCNGLKMREMSAPRLNGNSMRSSPPTALSASSVQPTPMLPYPAASVSAYPASATPTTAVVALRARVDKRRKIRAYIMLPIYSKKSDHVGPLSGNISPLPRTS